MTTAAITNGPALSSIASSVDNREPSVSYTSVSWSDVLVVNDSAPVRSAIAPRTSVDAPGVTPVEGEEPDDAVGASPIVTVYTNTPSSAARAAARSGGIVLPESRPSLNKTTAAGRSPSPRSAWIASSADERPSPITVPVPGSTASDPNAVATRVRSDVGRTGTALETENVASPTRNPAGSRSRNAVAATCAAARRFGSTSVDPIECDTSIASTTVPAVTCRSMRTCPNANNRLTIAPTTSATGSRLRHCGPRRFPRNFRRRRATIASITTTTPYATAPATRINNAGNHTDDMAT